MAVIFDGRPQVKRWRDTDTGQFAKEPVEWQITIEYAYRRFGGIRVSPPLADAIEIPWGKQKPTLSDISAAIAQHETDFRARQIYVFNQSWTIEPMNVS